MQSQGIHLIGDLYDCDLSGFVTKQSEVEQLSKRLSALVSEHELVEVGNCYHFFNPQAVTGSICLAESHLNFHTWPEEKYVSLDIYACSRASGSSVGSTQSMAEKLFHVLADEVFYARTKNVKVLLR